VRAAALIVIAACAGTVHRVGSRDEVVQRIISSDAAGLATMLKPGVFYGGLWFDDPACQQQFVAPGAIGADRVATLASCIAGLHLRATERSHPYDDVIELEYAPGFEVEAQFDDDGAIVWIGYAGRHDLRDALPTITPAALEALRTSGASPPALDDHVHARLRAERAELGVDVSYVWLKLCLDTDGRVTSTHPRQESSPIAADVFSAAVTAWTFKPFVAGGRAIPVCTMAYFTDPPSDHDAELPDPLPQELGSVVVSSQALHRLSGRTQLWPSDREKFAIQKLHLRKIIGSFAYCIDEHGAVAKVATVRPTGLTDYDERLAAAIHGWTFKPFVVEGTVRPACASIKFIYNQH
jgi:hypothetical protein